MFDFVRNNTKIMMGILFLLIIPSFVLFGLEGYSGFKDQGATVAKVNGNKISQGDWDAAHKREVDRIRASMPNIDVKVFDTPEAKYATLERLVRDQVVAAATRKLNLIASDTKLARELQSIPAIAALRLPDGKLDMERYKQLAASQGMTPEMFEMQMRADISNQQLIQGVQGSAFATLAQTQTAMNAFMQRREVQIVNFPVTDFLSKVNVSDADLQAYYDKNANKFQSAESADIEYVVLDIESLRQTQRARFKVLLRTKSAAIVQQRRAPSQPYSDYSRQGCTRSREESCASQSRRLTQSGEGQACKLCRGG
jgi:peptidyl-prolyl cis-trans isomerase D